MAKSRWAYISAAIVSVIAGLIFLWLQMPESKSQLVIGSKTFDAVILSNEQERIRGLSGTKSLPADRAMLFVFDQDFKWGIWMKDMNFPIDIIWADEKGKVVYLVEDAQPKSYPETTYRPENDARYVIEAISGTIKRTGLKMGDTVQLPSGV